MKTISGLAGIHRGEVLTAIGRGPSLARLQPEHLDGVVMAINQAIVKVEEIQPDNPLYSLQKDHLYTKPVRATLLLHELEALKEVENVDYEPAYSFDAERDFDIRWDIPSVVIAEKLANWFGCTSVVYLCCDAVTDGITDAYGAPATKPRDYLAHGPLVKQHATLPVTWKRI
jgi:hypothetical protein